MKPTPQITSPRNLVPRPFPQTDFEYQTTLETPRTSSSSQKVRLLHGQRPLWKFSTEFFRAESSWSFIREFVSLIALGGLAAWPVIFAMYSITRMVRGY